MTAQKYLIGLLGILGAAALEPMTARADGYFVEYDMHATPTDPQSAVEFRVRLSLVAEDQEGDSIGWDVKEIELIQNPGEHNERSWSKISPLGATLWWIEHNDPGNPAAEEFDAIPFMTGIAAANNSTDADLDFTLESIPYAPPPNLGVPTASTDHTFQEEGQESAVHQGQDQPATIDVLEQ